MQRADKAERSKLEMSISLAVLEKEKEQWRTREDEINERIAVMKRQVEESHLYMMRHA